MNRTRRETLGSKIMTRKLLVGCIGLAGSALTGWAQVQSPVLGYVPDGGSVRLMLGIPASGTIGAAVPAASQLAQTAVAPSGRFALAVTGDGQAVVAILGGAEAQLQPIADAIAGADRISLSPSGTSAVLLNSSNGSAQVISGLPNAAIVARSITFSASPSSLAVSDDGEWVVAVSGEGAIAYGPSSQPAPLPVEGAVSALAFLNNSRDVVTTTASAVTLISDVSGSASAVTLHAAAADAPAPTESPIAIAVSADNNHIVLMEPSGWIGHLNRATGAISVTDCQCAPTGLFSLGGSVFRLTGVDGGSAKVFDASTDSVWFVPQALEVAGGAQ
jgi:hypothetical protein